MNPQFGSQQGKKAAGPAPQYVTLSERLRQIGKSAAALEDALDPALAAIMEASGAAAAAICLYDPGREILRLAAESGLSDEGCRRLRTVRRGDPMSWDMPLQGLLNRRVYLIESASRNRYVPPLVEPASSVTTVACLPIFDGVTRFGSLVVVACAPRAITEADVRGLDKPLRELATVLEAAKRCGTAAGSAAPPPAPAAASPHKAAAPEATPAPAPAPAEPAPAERAATRDVEALIASLAAAERERDRLAAALEAVAVERAEQARAQALLSEGGAAQRTDEIARLMARIGEFEGAAARERDRVSEWEREHKRLADELEAAAERERRMREQLEDVLARATGSREADLRDALERARVAEDARESANRDAETARAALARAEGVARALESEKSRMRDEVEHLLAAVQAMLAERERLERGLAEARTREEEARARVVDLEQQVAALRNAREADASARTVVAEQEGELDRMIHRLAEAEAAAARERDRVGEWEREREQLATELREAAARERQVREDLRLAMERSASAPGDGLPQALDRVRAAEEARTVADTDARAARSALANAEAAVKALQDEKTRAREEIDRLHAAENAMLVERQRLEGALGETRDRESEARARLLELERAVDGLRAEREAETAALTARVDSVAAERDRLRTALAAVQVERDQFAAETAAGDAAHARLEEALVRDAAARDVAPVKEEPAEEEPAEEDASEPLTVEIRVERPPPEVLAPAPASVGVAAGVRRIVVLDEGGAWASAARSGEEVIVVSPKDAAARIAQLAPARMLVNLAAPGVMEALCALRAAGSTTRFTGCLLLPGADRALPLGTIEPVVRPLEPDTVLAALHGLATRGTRVLTTGTSAEALISLRQALTREGMSVSMAWDGKQATDLLGMARPEVVVVELSLPPRAGYRFVAQLAACNPVPHAVLVPGDDDPAAGFAAALSHPMHMGWMLPLARVLARVQGGPDKHA